MYGHRFGNQDGHLIEAIRSWINTAGTDRTVSIAVSIHAQDADQVITEKDRIGGLFDGAAVSFFQSRTFPIAGCIPRSPLGRPLQ